MTLVDTSVWIDFFRGTETAHTQWLDENLQIEPLASLDLIVCECLQGAASDREANRIYRQLTKLSIFETDLATAVKSARNYRTLRARGLTVRSTVDCLIATFCIDTGIGLLHCDRYYSAFSTHLGLKIINP